METSEILVEGCTVSSRSHHLDVYILDVTSLNRLLETSFHLIILSLQIALLNLYLIVLDIRIRESCQLNLTLFVFLLESHLSFYRI